MDATPGAGPGPDPGPEPEFGASLVSRWAVCAIAAAASRFVPVPLLDDAVKSRSTRIAVLVTVRDAGRRYPAESVSPLWDGVEGFADGLRRFARQVPRKIVLYPVRKYVELFGSVRGVPQDVMQVMLLARTVHRCLERGLLAEPGGSGATGGGPGSGWSGRAGRRADKQSLQAESERIRRAFDTAVDGMDLTLISGALADGLSQGKGLTTSAVGYARKLFGSGAGPDEPAETGQVSVPRPDADVEQGAEEIERVWGSPKVTRLLHEFDARFDAILGP